MDNSTNQGTSTGHRYLLFADILGTKSLYLANPPNKELIQRKRNSLGHAIRIAIYPYFSGNNGDGFEISLFSDTELVASRNIKSLADSAANLYYTFAHYGLQANTLDALYLLRGGLSHGERSIR